MVRIKEEEAEDSWETEAQEEEKVLSKEIGRHFQNRIATTIDENGWLQQEQL
jgi:hypothetical protein